MFRKIIATAPTWITVPVRLALGLIFIAHGAQKVLGYWGGQGFSAFIQYKPPFDFMRPGWLWMAAAALSELIGGILVLVGLLTRLSALFLAIVMLVAMFGVHWGAFFANNKGIEYPLALLGMAIALIIAGGGQASIDRLLMNGGGRRR
ncbi:MAG: DoxX family protein [Acidobacteria bacterium]|nr:DoxX family protein [Acidobacteriota bacterium]